jgi:hypothetical protein
MPNSSSTSLLDTQMTKSCFPSPLKSPKASACGTTAETEEAVNATAGRVASTCRNTQLETSFAPLDTLMTAVSGEAIFEAGICAVSFLELT